MSRWILRRGKGIRSSKVRLFFARGRVKLKLQKRSLVELSLFLLVLVHRGGCRLFTNCPIGVALVWCAAIPDWEVCFPFPCLVRRRG